MNSRRAEQRRPKVLIVDDTPANIQVLNEVLGDGYEIFFATSGREGLVIAERETPDLILLDVMMPEMDGYQVCSRLKSDRRTSEIPVIFVTALGSEEEEAKGLEYGAIDYITKPISPPIVQMRVKNHLELKRHRDLLKELSLELAEKNRELERLACEDGLTGIANRRYFDTSLRLELKRAYRSQRPLSLLMCDVDYFKSYNDHYGHVAGDKCLQAIGRLLRGICRRAGDLPARYGGEEFTVILPETCPDAAGQIAETLRQAMMGEGIPHALSSVAGTVTLSVGVVGGEVTPERDGEWFVTQADKALYRSKKEGRNRVTIADAT